MVVAQKETWRLMDQRGDSEANPQQLYPLATRYQEHTQESFKGVTSGKLMMLQWKAPTYTCDN